MGLKWSPDRKPQPTNLEAVWNCLKDNKLTRESIGWGEEDYLDRLIEKFGKQSQPVLAYKESHNLWDLDDFDIPLGLN